MEVLDELEKSDIGKYLVIFDYAAGLTNNKEISYLPITEQIINNYKTWEDVIDDCGFRFEDVGYIIVSDYKPVLLTINKK